MSDSNTLLEHLTRRSMHLNRGLLAVLGLALSLFAVLYGSTQRLLDEQHSRARLHFTHLMENIHEQERFLRHAAAQQAAHTTGGNDEQALNPQGPPPRQGPSTGQDSPPPYANPFSLHVNPQQPTASELPKVFATGLHLSTLYRAFWSASPYPAPRSVLFNSYGRFYFSVPVAGPPQGHPGPADEPDPEVLERRLRHRLVMGNGAAGNPVHWETYAPAAGEHTGFNVLAYVQLHLKDEHLHTLGDTRRMVLASLLNLDHANHIEGLMARSVYNHFTLIAPSGKVLVGPGPAAVGLHEGLNLGLHGLTYQISSDTANPWVALYSLNHGNDLGYALWACVGLGGLGLIALIGGWRASRWYRKRILVPTRQAQQCIADSEAFSQVLIDTAPTGLCVVRRRDRKVLLENRQAQAWQSTAKLVALLHRDPQRADAGETQVEIDGRPLQVGFVTTRYQGQEVLLCAFNDMTPRLEDAALQAQAQRSAGAASEAKALFLTTMSHEIRTPLHSVLDTLELIDLTLLDRRQQDYLHTIQRSSSTLFQLISDVLDVAKIDAGQMALEPAPFCPLDLIEDCLHRYAACAERKGLRLYACLDPRLPNLLHGDATRLRQILDHLLSNAIKFTDAGRVVLRARVLEHQDTQVRLEWQVTDTGIGIAGSEQPKVFDPFYQVREPSREAGAGLGLAIGRSLSTMMGGTMSLTSDPGLGSSFSLRLSLSALPGPLPDAQLPPASQGVYVRAPVPELMQSTCDWLKRLGVTAHPLPPTWDPPAQRTVLVDLLPDPNLRPWPGPCIRALSPGRALSGLDTGRDVDAYDIRAIARAVSLAQRGQPLDTPLLEHATSTPLAPVPEPEPEPEQDSLQVPPRMRDLFVRTMREDMRQVVAALDQGNSQVAAECLHRIAGAMGAVRATDMARIGAELECRLQETPLSAALSLEVQHLLGRIDELMVALE
ncbi:hypothetical protein BK634_17775 [Pseudomonas chlororaphis]|nr:hypothetical protein BK634_17775 [Pseudomonas chlororaphis]